MDGTPHQLAPLVLAFLAIAAVAVVASARPRTDADPPIAPHGIPFLGHLPIIAKGSRVFAKRLFEGINSDVVEASMLQKRVYLIKGPELCRRILTDVNINTRTVNEEGVKELGEFKAGFLFNNDIESWKRNRKKLIESVARPKFLKGLKSKIFTFLTPVLNQLDRICDAGGPILANKLFGSISLDIILDITFSVKPTATHDYLESLVNTTKNDENTMLKLVHDSFEAFDFFSVIPSLLFNYVPSYRAQAQKLRKPLNELTDFIRKKVASRYEKIQQHSYEMDIEDMTTALILNSKEWDLEKEVVLLRSVVGGGTDTSSNTMCFFTYELARNPKIAEEIFLEIEDAINSTDSGQLLDIDFSKLHLLEAALHETMRLHSVAQYLNRHLHHDIEVGGYQLKKNSMLLLLTQFNHEMEMQWHEAQKFIPERFLEPRQLGGPLNCGFAYITFGYGSRKCPGESLAMTEMKIVLANMCYRYQFALPDPETPLEIRETLVLECLDLPIIFKRR
ncbi:Cytochrome P450 3A4 [Entophlyctis luteolus]|nr:Cytochrome P450 3A4 [Entophlyctis luteolus]